MQRHTFAKHLSFWTAQYRKNGEEGLMHGLNRAFSPEMKFAAIRPVLQGTVSVSHRSRETLIRDSQLTAWIGRYREKGMEGLKFSGRGRKPGNMKDKERDGKRDAAESGSDLTARIKDLEHQLLLKQAEIDYLKN